MLELALVMVRLAEEAPADNDVVAGWGALLMFIFLLVAVALLGISLTKHLRKAQAASDAGVFGAEKPEGANGTDQSA